VQTTTVHLPADASGRALATVIHQLRKAVLNGDVLIDSRKVRTRSPGLPIVWRHHKRLARRTGARWFELRADPP
jgi:hypothetical protein